ncbi:response regulator [Polymorphobacter sp. PAMC 29334]|uniref:sensor histidine kinase n=1 Tax=Polymorphobacter sp. PAMC 29334 TaxID=2862331 RepID=UPI001C76C23E|nr:response regulator [Polymorphobacter sp. PAMC 29334]QYE36421.1 response regulator [Polymorphobacter sp. PAMC 29334]
MTERPRILYIDDDEGLCRLVSRALGKRGYDVSVATNGLDGVAEVKKTVFDLIAVDHYMPGYDGLSTLEALRALPDVPPIIYVTGSEESRIAVAALKAGAIDYVVKTIGDDFFDLLTNAFDTAMTAVALKAQKVEAEVALRASNARLEALLHEVNHRVANSLQLVSAFIHLQAKALTDPAAKSALADTQARITAIAQVHKRLYTSDDVEGVAMDDYLAALVRELEKTWSTPASPRALRLIAAPIRLATDRAVSLGVIVNELVSNACKYAYPQGQPGEIRIELALDGARDFVLRVEDDGAGLPASKLPTGTGIGTKLIGAMAASLGSNLVYDPAYVGVRATLRASV